jgi:CBS domain-containing protein
MRPPRTSVEDGAHVAAAVYLMKHARATALMVRSGPTDQPIGIITEADIARAVAAGKDVSTARVHSRVTIRRAPISPAATLAEAAAAMARDHLRHLPVADDDSCLVGILDIADVCGALTEDVSRPPSAVGAGPG